MFYWRLTGLICDRRESGCRVLGIWTAIQSEWQMKILVVLGSHILRTFFFYALLALEGAAAFAGEPRRKRYKKKST
ncbi:MAG TPA: hypothetical protein PK694_03715 [Rhodospirillales bacterium]|jgi:hypothetical protein|nr:hypothetical protein [Rhodospirillales bacterium]